MRKIYTPPSQEDCPECIEQISSKCVVEESSFTALGLGNGKTLSEIIKALNKKIAKFSKWFNQLIYNFEPEYETGLSIASYTNGSCTEPKEYLNIPLFINGKHCFEYDVDEETVSTFSVSSIMGEYTFYDEDGNEVVDEELIQIYLNLFTEKLPRPICCCSGGEFIPLAGTDSGSPVTGDIEFDEFVSLTWNIGSNNFYVQQSDEYLQLGVDNGAEGTNLNIDSINSNIIVVCVASSKGLIGSSYYGANYDANTYVQKKYVDEGLGIFTVATLPIGSLGETAIVTDATAPTYLGVLVGGGAVVCPVWHDGVSWKSR